LGGFYILHVARPLSGSNGGQTSLWRPVIQPHWRHEISCTEPRAATGDWSIATERPPSEKGCAIANHASTRTTQLCDRRRDGVSLDEVERIVI